jgi:hypothetical protein
MIYQVNTLMGLMVVRMGMVVVIGHLLDQLLLLLLLPAPTP